eukprot:s234_g15.t1
MKFDWAWSGHAGVVRKLDSATKPAEAPHGERAWRIRLAAMEEGAISVNVDPPKTNEPTLEEAEDSIVRPSTVFIKVLSLASIDAVTVKHQKASESCRLESRAFTTYTGEVQVHDVFGLPSTVKRHVVRLDVATDSLLTLQTEVHRDTPTTLAVDIFRQGPEWPGQDLQAAEIRPKEALAFSWGEICLEPGAKTPRTTSLVLVLLVVMAACASLAFTFAATSGPMASNLPQHARPAMPASHVNVADNTPLLGPQGLMRVVRCNKTGLMLMIVFSLAICLVTALEKQFVGELFQYCFIAGNRLEFWPRMRKAMVVLLLSPLFNWAYQLSAMKTSNDVKFSLQTAAFPRVLDSGTGFPEGAAASLFTGELDKLTNVSEKFLRGVVGCVVYSQVANAVVAEVKVAEETRAYHATLERATKLQKVMWTRIEKQLEHGKQRELWKAVDSLRQNGNLIAIHFLLGVAVMVGEFPFAIYHASFGISISLTSSLRDLLQGLMEMRECGETISKINQLTTETEPNPLATKGTPCLQHSSLNVMDLCVERNTTPLLQDISFKVLPEQLVAIVGASGSGKTTLLRVLAGRESEFSGQIDGRGSVALLPQVVPMFPDTLRENVAVSRNMSNQTIISIISDGHVEGGKGWPSGGQRQRIGLARVICDPPELLLLDEPTSALDVDLEKEVFKTMKRLAKEHSMMILMVTHRVTLAEQSDQAFLHGLLSGKDHQVDIVFDLVSMDVVSSQVDSKVSEAKCWPVRIDLTAVPVARAALHWPSVCPSEDRLPKPIGSNVVVLGDRGLEFSGGASATHFAYRFAEERPWTAFQKPLWSSTLEVPPRLHRFVRFFMRVSFRFASGPLQAEGRIAGASPNLQ